MSTPVLTVGNSPVLLQVNDDGTTELGTVNSGTWEGTPVAAAYVGNLPAGQITSGQLSVAQGGTGADLSTTGGTSNVLTQTTVGGAVTVAQLAQADISGLTTTDSPTFANVTVTTPGVGGSNVEVQSNKNATNGYAGLDASGDLVGSILFQQASDSSMGTVVLLQGQPGYGQTTGKLVIGDGSTSFQDLAGWSGEGNNFQIIGSSLQVSNGDATTRGTGAVDLQFSNSVTGQVAAGDYSIVAGQGNLASGANAVAMGGGTSGCIAGGANSFAVGGASTALGQYSVALGSGSLAYHTNGFVNGLDNKSTGSYGAVLDGNTNNVYAAWASVLNGTKNQVGPAPLAFTASGTTGTIAGNVVLQLTGSTTGISGQVVMFTLTGTGTSNIASEQTITSVSYSSPNTTFTFANPSGVTITGGVLTASVAEPGNYTYGAQNSHLNRAGMFATIENGASNEALGAGSVVAGFFAQSYLPNQHVHGTTVGTSGGAGFLAGNFQMTDMLFVAKTTNATPALMTTDGNAAVYTNQIGANNFWYLPSNKTIMCKALVTGRSASGTGFVGQEYQLLASVDSGGTVTVGSNQLGSTLSDGTYGNTWSVAFAADNTNQGIQINVTGASSTTIYWCARVVAIEVVQ